MNALLPGLLSAALAALPDSVPAPTSHTFAVEARGGLSIGAIQSSGSGFERNPAGAWRISILYLSMSQFGLYAGYGHGRLHCSGGLCSGRDVEFSVRGVDAGLWMGLEYAWARAGLVYHSLTAEWSVDAPRTASAPPGLGVELAAGAALPLAARVEIMPGIRITAFTARFAGDAASDRVHVIVGDIGVRYRIR